MHGPLLVGGEVAGRGERLRVRVRPGDVVQREHPSRSAWSGSAPRARARARSRSGRPTGRLRWSVRLRIRHGIAHSRSSLSRRPRRPVARSRSTAHSSGPRPIEQRPRRAADHDRPDRERPERLEVAESARGRRRRRGPPSASDRPDHELRGVGGERHRPDGAQRKHDPGEHACGTRAGTGRSRRARSRPSRSPRAGRWSAARAVHTAPQNDVASAAWSAPVAASSP